MPDTAEGKGDTMEFVGKDRKVNEWIEGVQKNRGINAELTLDYCRKIEEYAKAAGITPKEYVDNISLKIFLLLVFP